MVARTRQRYTASNKQLLKLRQQTCITLVVPLVWRNDALQAEYDFELPDGHEHLDAKVVKAAAAVTIYSPGDGRGLAGTVGIMQPPERVYANKVEIVVMCDLIVVYEKQHEARVTKAAVAAIQPAWAIQVGDTSA